MSNCTSLPSNSREAVAAPAPVAATVLEPALAAALTSALVEQVGILHQVGIRTVLIHGGGPQSTELASALGLDTQFVEGRRITDSESLNVATMILNGQINTRILAAYLGPDGRLVGADYALDMYPRFGFFTLGQVQARELVVGRARRLADRPVRVLVLAAADVGDVTPCLGSHRARRLARRPDQFLADECVASLVDDVPLVFVSEVTQCREHGICRRLAQSTKSRFA